MKRFYLSLAVVLSSGFIFILLFNWEQKGEQKVPLEPGFLSVTTGKGTFRFSVELALSESEQEQGLMYRRSMAKDHGMLFVFEYEKKAYFWMKNTYLSLDMIFVKADGRVYHIARDTIPLSLESVSSNGPVRAVFEVVAGTVDHIGLKVDDQLHHPAFMANF